MSATETAAVAAATNVATPGEANPAICRFFLRGICRFGDLCRFSHDLTAITSSNSSATTTTTTATAITNTTKPTLTIIRTKGSGIGNAENAKPSTSKSWANAPVFIPKVETKRSWAEVAAGAVDGVVGTATAQGVAIETGLCMFEYDCPYGDNCFYQHIELCEMCDSYCLHPTDLEQRRKHIQECLQQHERDMELSFAIARSKDKQCGICFDTIMEKTGREKRFGILPNCSHIFCLECIRKWRQAKQFEHKITRACPECRVASDFVCPSAFWVDTKEEKDKLLVDYRNALGVKDCKYFKKGDGKCPFGNKCFYKHALPNGDLVDVGLPQRARKLHRHTDELIDLLDIYLWEFVDQRDYWLEMHSNPSDIDDSDWSED